MNSKEYETLVSGMLACKSQGPVKIQVHRDKKYLGKSGHSHQIDVSAELQVAGLDIIIIFECKKYSRKVGIDDVMELSSRVDDIHAHKGVLVTTIGFQKGAVRLAKSVGISLVKAGDFGWEIVFADPYADLRIQGFEYGLKMILNQLHDKIDDPLFSEQAFAFMSQFDYIAREPRGFYPFYFLMQKHQGTWGKIRWPDRTETGFNLFTTIAGTEIELVGLNLDTTVLVWLQVLEVLVDCNRQDWLETSR